jgi:hypothetical protein
MRRLLQTIVVVNIGNGSRHGGNHDHRSLSRNNGDVDDYSAHNYWGDGIHTGSEEPRKARGIRKLHAPKRDSDARAGLSQQPQHAWAQREQ